jgi:hypothetical protein
VSIEGHVLDAQPGALHELQSGVFGFLMFAVKNSMKRQRA